jgi:DNA-binding winged helix-turn-helix (wHTH) protein
MDEIARKVFRFEEFTLDVMRRSLRQGNEDAQLRPKSFDVLCYMVENAGRPLSKDEIIAAAWPKVIVTDESLTRCVSDVRLALRDGDQRIVKTIPRHGYLFCRARPRSGSRNLGAGDRRGGSGNRPAGPSSTFGGGAPSSPSALAAFLRGRRTRVDGRNRFQPVAR